MLHKWMTRRELKELRETQMKEQKKQLMSFQTTLTTINIKPEQKMIRWTTGIWTNIRQTGDYLFPAHDQVRHHIR